MIFKGTCVVWFNDSKETDRSTCTVYMSLYARALRERKESDMVIINRQPNVVLSGVGSWTHVVKRNRFVIRSDRDGGTSVSDFVLLYVFPGTRAADIVFIGFHIVGKRLFFPVLFLLRTLLRLLSLK